MQICLPAANYNKYQEYILLNLIQTTDCLSSFDKTDIFITKIMSNMITYRSDNRLLTWAQDSHALFQMFDGSAAFYADENADFDEIRDFIRFLGGAEIFTSRKCADRLSADIQSGGIIMKRSYTSPVSSGFKPPPFPEYSKIYDLLNKTGFTLPPKDSFLCDLHARFKRKTARIFCNDDYSSLALTGFETKECAVISAVATDPDFQNTGLGSTALISLCSALEKEKKVIYLYRENDKNERFYNKNGFENYGEFVICKIQ